MAVSLGQMRERVIFMVPDQLDDGLGGDEGAFSPLAECFAKVTPEGGGQAVEAGQLASRMTYRFEVRFRTDLSIAHRLEWGGVTYEIRRLSDETGYRDILTVLATEIS